MSTHGSYTLPKSHEIQTKLLTKSKYVPENLSMKLLCDIMFLSFSGQSDIPCFKMTIFHLDDHHWQHFYK